MSSQIPFTPVTPEALARLTPAERDAFTTAAEPAAGQVTCRCGGVAHTTERYAYGKPGIRL